jgi:hypothetical protein
LIVAVEGNGFTLADVYLKLAEEDILHYDGCTPLPEVKWAPLPMKPRSRWNQFLYNLGDLLEEWSWKLRDGR